MLRRFVALAILLLLNHIDQEHLTVVSGQSTNGPRLSLRAEIIPNNGLVSAESIGELDTEALLCITESIGCCSDRVSEQQWLFPNGTRVPLRESGWKFWSSYGDGIIRLHRQTDSDANRVHGLFRCQIPNQSRISLTLFVGIYPTNESHLSLPAEMTFHLETEVSNELHTFTLICNSTGGPVMEVNWTRNGEPINEEWNQYSIVTNFIEGMYHNWLFVPGPHEGLYHCTVFNNEPGSSVTALLSVNAPQRPVVKQLLHLSLTSLSVSWDQPSSFASAQILYYEANGITNIVNISDGSTTTYVLANLQSGLTYSVSLQALSPQLPSPITDPFTTTLGIVSSPSIPRVTSITPLSSSLDIHWEYSGDTVNKFRLEATYIGPCRDEFGDRITNEVNGNALQYNLINLKEYSTYSVVVIAVNNAGEISGQEQQATTLPAAPTMPPTLTSVSPINASTISIEWEDNIPCQDRNGEITGLEIRARSRAVSNFDAAVTYTIHNTTSHEGQQHAINLTWLSPSFAYEISVAAVNIMGQRGTYSSLLQVQLQDYDDVGLMLHGRLLPNHSYVSSEELGQGRFDSLLCLTDKNIYDTRPRNGEWYYPNGTRVPTMGVGWRFYRDRHIKIVRLHQRVSSVGVFGMFRCEVKNNTNIPHILYAGLFPAHGGLVELSFGIQVQLESDIRADVPQFTLYTESTGGPLTNVVWSLDDASINSSFSSSFSLLMDSQTAKYGVFLRVEGRLTGLYRVIVSNNKPSMATRAVNVYSPDPPANLTIKQIEHNQLLLSWIPPPQPVTGYHIYVEPRRDLDVEYWFAERNSSQFIIHSLRERAVYNVSMLALSPFLPSLLAGPIEVTLRQVPYRLRIDSSPETRTVVSGQSYLLTCTISLNEPTHSTQEGLDAINVQWLNVTRNSTFSQTIPHNHDIVSVSNLTAVRLDEYTLSLHSSRAGLGTYHSGNEDYACQAEIDGIIRKLAITITVNRQLTTEEVLEYSVINSTSFIVRWLKLQFPYCISNCNTTTIQYQIRYGIVGAGEVRSVQTTRREVIATGLTPLRNYSFEVTAVNNNNQLGRYTNPVYLFMPAERVGLIHSGQAISNNSYIPVESLGTLLCVTDKVDCCRGDGIDALSHQRAWYYPNGTTLSSMGVLYQERSTSMIRMLHSDSFVPFGLYRCTIPDKSNVNHSLYIGIYSSIEGNLSISQDIEFHLATTNNIRPVFILRCVSNGGPVRQVMWTRNGTTLSSELTDVIQHPSVIIDKVTAQYEHRLTVMGQVLGSYRCNVTNNKPSLAYKDIGIFNAEPPVALHVQQYNLTTMRTYWNPPVSGPEVTGYEIHYTSNSTDSWLMVDSQTLSALISGLQSGDVYWVSAVALSYFPSLETEPIEIFLYPMEVTLAEEGLQNVSTGQSFTLTCIAILAPRTDIDWELKWLDSNGEVRENTNLTTSDTHTGAQEHTFVLVFNDIDLSDADEYTCQAIANYSGGSQVKMSSVILSVEIPSPTVNISIQDDNQRIRYSGTTSPILICSALLSPNVDIPINVNFQWFGPNGVISEESGGLTSGNELSSNIVVTLASVNDSGEYTCLINVSSSHMSPFITPSQMVSQTLFLTIVPIQSPSGAPLNFTVRIDGPRTLTFTWRAPRKHLQNGPIIGYHLQCFSIHNHGLEMDLTADDSLQLSNDGFSASEFLPNISYNCSVSAATSAGRGPIASLTVSTPEDIALFQLHFLGVFQCSQWLMQCAASGTSNVTTVSNLVEQSLSNTYDASHLNFTVVDDGFMCGPNPEQLTFRAKLVAKGHRNTSDILSSLEEWLQSNAVININGAILRLNKMCNLTIPSLGVDLCDTDVIVTTPRCDSELPQPSASSNLCAIIGGGVATVLVLVIIVSVAIIVAFLNLKCLNRAGRYNIVKKKRPKDGRVRSSVTDNNMTVLRGEPEMESCMQYYTNMTPSVCAEDGDYASVSSNPRYSVGLSLNKMQLPATENKMQLPATDPHLQEDIKCTVGQSIVADGEPQDLSESKSDEEGIYEEPNNLVGFLQIVHMDNECKVVADPN